MTWSHLVVRGGLAVVFGVVAMLFPLSTATALALLWGVWALADGALTLVQAFGAPRSPVRPVLGAMGIVALLAGALAVSDPGLTAVTLTRVLGIWLIARGLLEAVVALLDREAESRAGMLLSGAVDVVLGLLFVLNPGRSAVGLAVVLGLVAAVWGVVLVIVGFLVRRRHLNDGAAVHG
ncbi:HdeD family acid-resistance protein [Nocardioides astragali]|uniref:HdeD family acid-resistance protein n=2 Tax=Nocardioides astragali TaxID=1776736 RepID=A0ABW2N9B5_9ACTN